MYPSEFNRLLDFFTSLPSVGSKTALRYAFHLLKLDETQRKEIIKAISELTNIKHCENCGFLSNHCQCEICSDLSRDKKIMVVFNASDVVAIENLNIYHGYYHVLNGLISPNKGIMPEDINLDSLFKRLDNVNEIILALPSTMDGEITSLYIDKLLSDYNINITKLASGIPMGTSLDYADGLTLSKALENRTKIKE